MGEDQHSSPSHQAGRAAAAPALSAAVTQLRKELGPRPGLK